MRLQNLPFALKLHTQLVCLDWTLTRLFAHINWIACLWCSSDSKKVRNLSGWCMFWPNNRLKYRDDDRCFISRRVLSWAIHSRNGMSIVSRLMLPIGPVVASVSSLLAMLRRRVVRPWLSTICSKMARQCLNEPSCPKSSSWSATRVWLLWSRASISVYG